MKLTLAVCAEWMHGELHGDLHGAAGHEAVGYSIDTRTLKLDELFFAVSGERFDAHAFLYAAKEQGAVAVVAHRDRAQAVPPGMPWIGVEDPLAALQRLAAAVRRHWHGTLVGITGSAGKTTTKEMVAAVLASQFTVLKSAGNLNNHFGVPLQLLRLEPEHQYAVIEMGMSAAGEIALLGRLAAPDWGIVTNVGAAHTQNFADGIDGVARAKRELIEALDPEHGTAILNADDARVRAFADSFEGRVVLAGRSAEAEVRAVRVEERGLEGLRLEVEAHGERAVIDLQLMGVHNAQNALLALAAGMLAGIPLQQSGAALAALTPGEKRGELLHMRGATLINDCYNSNPAALEAMIATLAQMPAQRRILVAGEMLELGPESKALHADCGRAAARAGLDVVLGVRGDAAALVEAAQPVEAYFVETPEAAGAWLRAHLQAGDAVLLKASRGVQLERALEALSPTAAAESN